MADEMSEQRPDERPDERPDAKPDDATTLRPHRWGLVYAITIAYGVLTIALLWIFTDLFTY